MFLDLENAPDFSNEQIRFLEHIFFNRLMNMGLLLEISSSRLSQMQQSLEVDDIKLKNFFQAQIVKNGLEK